MLDSKKTSIAVNPSRNPTSPKSPRALSGPPLPAVPPTDAHDLHRHLSRVDDSQTLLLALSPSILTEFPVLTPPEYIFIPSRSITLPFSNLLAGVSTRHPTKSSPARTCAVRPPRPVTTPHRHGPRTTSALHIVPQCPTLSIRFLALLSTKPIPYPG